MAQAVWPWLALAAAGALHGLNPAGWAVAAWRGRRAGTSLAHCVRAIALGHIASVLALAAAVPASLNLGVAFDPVVLQVAAAVVLAVLVLRHLRGGLAVWSFIVGTAHGTGWMLVPAIVPLCATGLPGAQVTASGSIVLGLAAVGVHMGAMLATTALMARVVLAVARRDGGRQSPVCP